MLSRIYDRVFGEISETWHIVAAKKKDTKLLLIKTHRLKS